MKFKVGDKVKVIKPYDDIPVNTIGKIECVVRHVAFPYLLRIKGVREDGCAFPFKASELEKVKP